GRRPEAELRLQDVAIDEVRPDIADGEQIAPPPEKDAGETLPGLDQLARARGDPPIRQPLEGQIQNQSLGKWLLLQEATEGLEQLGGVARSHQPRPQTPIQVRRR